MQKIDSSNTQFLLAADLVNNTSKNIFLTGKAGTGKTTFLKYIQQHCTKQIAVVAPTGVAAINAGGVTIHSFFQLPFGPFIPEAKGFGNADADVSNKHTLLSRLRVNREKKRIWQQLELLVIDEISMVRADVLDAIDAVLRHFRLRPAEAFGGVQVLFIGDMFQLPPVVKDAEWSILKEHYRSPYFFDSHVVKEEAPVHIEFSKIYRQSDDDFIRLLNQVRNNELDEEAAQILQSRVQPSFFTESPKDYILLTTHNEKAGRINTEELEKIQQPVFSYKAQVKDDFPSSSFPASELLSLKVGAQVMFIKNDVEKARRYYNGKIGVVSELKEDEIFVQCQNEPQPIEVKKERWENIRYTVNKANGQLQEELLGSFTQYPLRLAWAITIHKSQGLTFEKAIIDASAAFAPGQVYVALSRCTSLEGLVLNHQISRQALATDRKIVQFSNARPSAGQLQQQIQEAKRQFAHQTYASVFNFKESIQLLNDLRQYVLAHCSSFSEDTLAWLDAMVTDANFVQATAEKFLAQLQSIFAEPETPKNELFLQDRIKAAARYFTEPLQHLIKALAQSPAVTDSGLHAKEFNAQVRELFTGWSLQNYLLQKSFNGCTVTQVYQHKKSFAVPPFSVNAYAGANGAAHLAHPELYHELRKLRDRICAAKNIPVYLVAGSKTLEEICRFLPLTAAQLEQISGFGKTRIKSYGKQFLEVVQHYCTENQLNAVTPEPLSKAPGKASASKPKTRELSYQLFRAGKSIAQIAKERKLVEQTVEGHLLPYVADGSIALEELVTSEKLVEIQALATDHIPLAALKEQLGSHVSFADLRFYFAAQKHQHTSA